MLSNKYVLHEGDVFVSLQTKKKNHLQPTQNSSVKKCGCFQTLVDKLISTKALWCLKHGITVALDFLHICSCKQIFICSQSKYKFQNYTTFPPKTPQHVGINTKSKANMFCDWESSQRGHYKLNKHSFIIKILHTCFSSKPHQRILVEAKTLNTCGEHTQRKNFQCAAEAYWLHQRTLKVRLLDLSSFHSLPAWVGDKHENDL